MKLVFTKKTSQSMLFLTVVLTINSLKELKMPSKLLMSLLGLLFTASTVLAQTPGGAPTAGAPKGPAPGGAPAPGPTAGAPKGPAPGGAPK
jgi:hypothetical protein